jgi:hypothetical protein
VLADRQGHRSKAQQRSSRVRFHKNKIAHGVEFDSRVYSLLATSPARPPPNSGVIKKFAPALSVAGAITAPSRPASCLIWGIASQAMFTISFLGPCSAGKVDPIFGIGAY